MKSIYNYIIFSQNRYNNSTYVEGKELILNTEITERDYQFVNRIGTIVSTPLLEDNPIKEGVEVILHHNVFRRWHNIRGEEKNSRSYIDDNNYCVNESQVFSYKRDNEDWKTLTQHFNALHNNFYDKLIEKLISFFNKMDESQHLELKRKSHQLYNKHYSWDTTAVKWMNYFDSVDVTTTG
mgnify:CR=1 FL=1